MPSRNPADTLTRLAELPRPVFSVYLPRPAIEIGGEKLRIATKNAVQALGDALDEGGELLRERLGQFEQDEFASPGLAFFAADGALFEAQLSSPPHALASCSDTAVWLPLIADLSYSGRVWTVIVDREAPRLLRATTGGLEDYSAIANLPDYDEIQARREPQINVLFHSTSSAQRTPGHGGFAKFHALGTSHEDEEEKTDEVFYRELAQGTEHAVPASACDILLVGDPNGVGHVRQNLETFGRRVSILGEAGDGSDEERVATATRNWLADTENDRIRKHLAELSGDDEIARGDLAEAGRLGRVETIWLSRSIAGLRVEPEDEHLRFDQPEEARALLSLQDELQPALKTGAELIVCEPDLMPDNREIVASARFDLEEPS